MSQIRDTYAFDKIVMIMMMQRVYVPLMCDTYTSSKMVMMTVIMMVMQRVKVSHMWHLYFSYDDDDDDDDDDDAKGISVTDLRHLYF